MKMRMIPANKDEWLTGALRVALGLFAGLCFWPAVVVFVIGPMRGEELVWLNASFLISYLVVGTTVVALSIVCRSRDRDLSRVSFWCVMITILAIPVILPALARAREKPVIYVYPETETAVEVRLKYEGKLTHSYPDYGDDGWKVIAKPSGELTDPETGRTYYCLFWEGEDRFDFTFDEGFVVAREETAPFLEEKLAILGLSEREANEFIIYWLPRLEKHPANIIHFSTDEYAKRVPLEITPVPDTVIRVFLVFEESRGRVKIKQQRLEPMTRQGFTVVEWGGTELR
jgi:uncharacterized protein YdhG (YjbR/CyaY superfamily)